MTANEIRELSLEELDAKVKELKQELFNLKFQNLAKLQDTPINTAKIREVKRDVARIKTIYKKRVKTSKKYKAHDEKNECGVGDKVQIMETRPLSREKRWRVVTILEKAK